MNLENIKNNNIEQLNLVGVTGIYKLENVINGNIYVGQTRNMWKRLEYHKNDLIECKHHQKNLQNEFNIILKQTKDKYKDNPCYNYISFKDMVFDTTYKMTPLVVFNRYNEEEMCQLEDEVILQYREIMVGYSQLTNAEIKQKYLQAKEDNIKAQIKERESWLNENKVNHIVKLQNDNGSIIEIDMTKFSGILVGDNDKLIVFVSMILNGLHDENNQLKACVPFNAIRGESMFIEDFLTTFNEHHGKQYRLFGNSSRGLTVKGLKNIFRKFNNVIQVKSGFHKTSDDITLNIDMKFFNNTFYDYYNKLYSEYTDILMGSYQFYNVGGVVNA